MAMTTAERAARKAQRVAQTARIAEAQANTRETVRSGKCPLCGQGIHRNLALTGWWQCNAAGESYMRPAKYRDLPKCTWQGFTE
jgi:ribosomal protein L37AE/L43A